MRYPKSNDFDRCTFSPSLLLPPAALGLEATNSAISAYFLSLKLLCIAFLRNISYNTILQKLLQALLLFLGEKMKIFNVNKNDDGKRIDAFFMRLMPSAPKSLIYKYIRTNKIKLNSKKPLPDTRIKEGDEIKFFGDETLIKTNSFTPQEYSLNIVYEDENILVINKPAGIACQPDRDRTNGTLADFVKSYLYVKNCYDPKNENSFAPALCNRIDLNTSGLVIAAKNAEALSFINSKFRAKEIRRFYVCKTESAPSPLEGVIKTNIKKDGGNNISKVDSDGKPSETHYRTLKVLSDGAIVEAEIITGRSHQIRVHLSYIGVPIKGDSKYGKGGKGQLLTAYRLLFNFKETGKFSYLSGKEFTVNYNF